MVKKVYFKGVKFSGYSNWHRQQHNCLGFSDIDQVSTCNACLKPLFLAETVFNNGQGWNKPHKVTKQLAELFNKKLAEDIRARRRRAFASILYK